MSPDLRGDLKGSLFIRSGIFQAIGVISFGRESENLLIADETNSLTSFRMPYVDQISHLARKG